MARIAINGFGRIGRLFLRQALGQSALDIVAINDLGDIENLAYLLEYDSVYRKYDKNISFERDQGGIGGYLIVGDKKIRFLQEKDPVKLPWKDLKIDIVIEATGAFESFEKSRVHISAGAKRVILTAPAKDQDSDDAKTVLVGINEDELKTCVLSSNASCTTNAVSPVVQILHEALGIKKAFLNTVHAYTATQNIVDGPVRGGRDFRRGRAAAFNISPSTTGAASAVIRVIKDLAGKFDGVAMRVPIVTGSIGHICAVVEKATTAEEVNKIFEKAASSKRWSGIVRTTYDQLVSSDIIGENVAAVVDLAFTKVIDGDFVNVFSWYDNEWGYVATLVRHASDVASYIRLRPSQGGLRRIPPKE